MADPGEMEEVGKLSEALAEMLPREVRRPEQVPPLSCPRVREQRPRVPVHVLTSCVS